MATIKGQNLRLLLDGRCIAVCQTSSFHAAAQTADGSSKDDTGDWARPEVTGLSWDAEATATVRQRTSRTYLPSGFFTPLPDNDSILYSPQPIPMSAGDVLRVDSSTAECLIIAGDFGRLDYVRDGNAAVFETQEDCTVYAGMDAPAADAWFDHTDQYGLSSDDLFRLMEEKTVLDAGFYTTSGWMNRGQDELLARGQAVITDIAVTAADRQLGTCTVKLSGTGELVLTEE